MTIWAKIKAWAGFDEIEPDISPQRRRTDTQLALNDSGTAIGALDLEREFVGLLLGVHSFVDCDLNNFERRALKAMEALNASDLSKSEMLPRLPVIVPELLRSVRANKAATENLMRHISRDLILVGQIVRKANSPRYRAGKEVKTLDEAVLVLGHNNLRQMVANISMKPVFNMRRGHFGPLAAPRLWAQSERCAVACRCLAKQLHVDDFEAYLTGLVSNTGWILGARVLDQVSDGTQAPHSVVFRQRWVRLGRLLTRKIAAQWQFPKALIDVLEQQVDADDVDQMGVMGGVVYAGEKLGQLRMLVEAGRMEDDFGRFTCRLSGKLTDGCSQCYAELAALSS